MYRVNLKIQEVYKTMELSNLLTLCTTVVPPPN